MTRNVQTPGSIPDTDPEVEPGPELDAEPEVVRRKAKAQTAAAAVGVSAIEMSREIDTLKALVQSLLDNGKAQQSETRDKPPKIIGEDMRPMTTTQVLAAVAVGELAMPARTVLCADGYLAVAG